jgi:hypothetical protein
MAAFVQRVISKAGEEFTDVQKAISEISFQPLQRYLDKK